MDCILSRLNRGLESIEYKEEVRLAGLIWFLHHWVFYRSE